MKEKERLDQLLVQKGYFASREKAKAVIMAGVVYVNGQKIDKAGTSVSPEVEIYIKENMCPYVSRGGLKLAKAIESFNIELTNNICIDMGASTGGFTDCMLQNGAKKVYSIDVGYGQLDWKLRNDPRIINMEKVNIRYLEEDKITDVIDFISIDVSFISLTMILPVAERLLKETGSIVCLVKPQFEAGREQVGKNGIVREPKIHEEVIRKVANFSIDLGLKVKGLTYSPMTGAKGNIEYLIFLEKKSDKEEIAEINLENQIKDVILEAHKKFSKSNESDQ